MVPGAIGSQTNGSVIRPAAFCGVVGFKPTHGLIPRSGALLLSRALDHVGVFARSVADAALLAETLAGFDEEDPDTRADRASAVRRCCGKRAAAAAALRLRPLAGLEASPKRSRRDAFAELVEALGEQVRRGRTSARALITPSTCIASSWKSRWRTTCIATSSRAATRLSSVLRALIERGRKRAGVDYTRALAGSAPLNQTLDSVFDEYDAILTPSAPGPAPRGLDSTGNPAFCTLWTYLGTPAVTLPLLTAENGLPIGVQLVGRRGNDARLLRTANWLVKTLGRGKRGGKATSGARGARTRRGR